MTKKEISQQPKLAASNATTGCILLVDDTPANIMALENLLEVEGRTFLKARDGKEAIKVALNEPVDLIISDVNMPIMNGYEVAEVLKSNEATRHIPIIFVTAMMKEPNQVLKGFDEGAVDYLVKPLDPKLTRSKVNSFLRMAEQNRKKSAASLSHDAGDDFIFIKTGTKYVKIYFREIFWLEAEGDYVVIHSEKGKHIVHSTMKTIEVKLPPSSFLRIHRSYIVNMKHVNAIHDFVMQVNGHTLAIGKSYQQKVLERLNRI